MPFLLDFEVHVRFLVALPLLIAAELVVHQRLRPAATSSPLLISATAWRSSGVCASRQSREMASFGS